MEKRFKYLQSLNRSVLEILRVKQEEARRSRGREGLGFSKIWG